MKLLLALLPLCASLKVMTLRSSKSNPFVLNSINNNNNDLDVDETTSFRKNKFDFSNILMTSTALSLLMPVQEAFAIGGEYGLLEGRIGSMLHPFTMLALFGTSVYSGYLGLQWRKLRDIGEQLKQLNSNIPKLSSGTASFPIASSIANLQSKVQSLNPETDSATISALKRDISSLSSVSSLDQTYTELSNTRKDLVSANLRDKHHLTGSVLLGVGVGVSLLGAMNTYLRAGKLFPGPHLYAGAAITG